MNDSPKISSKEILASKSYKGWKRSKKLKLALTASIGTASLAGGLVGGFAWKSASVVPALNAYLAENNLQSGEADSYAILNITETNKGGWIEPQIDLQESGLVIEPQSVGSQVHTNTYKIGIGKAQAGTYDITVSVNQFDDVNVSVTVLPAKEITATTSGQLQYGNTNKTANITVSAHDGATLPSGTPTLAGFTFTAFNPINEFQAQTTVRWVNASVTAGTNKHTLNITNGNQTTCIEIIVEAPRTFTIGVTDNTLQIGVADSRATLTVTETGVEQWIAPTVEITGPVGSSLAIDGDWTITGLTGSINIKLDESTVAGPYEIVVSSSNNFVSAATDIKVAPAKTLVAEILDNTLQVGMQNTSATLQVTQEYTSAAWADTNVIIKKDEQLVESLSVSDWSGSGLIRTANITPVVDQTLVSGTYTVEITSNGFLSGSATFIVLQQPKFNATITNNNFQIGDHNSYATLQVTELNTDTTWVEPNLEITDASGNTISFSLDSWNVDPSSMTGTVKITLNAMKDYVDGIYEIKITAEHFETAFVTFTILIQPFPEVEITNNNLQIGVNNSSATLKVTEYYTDTFIIPTVSIDYSESQTNFVISEWDVDGTTGTATITFASTASTDSLVGEHSIIVYVGNDSKTSQSTMFTVLPEKSLKVEAIFNNLEVDNMNSYALIDVQGCNLTLDGLPQISGLPTGLTPTWNKYDSPASNIYRLTLTPDTDFNTSGNFSITISYENLTETVMLYSKPTAQQISIVGSNSIDIYANKAGSESYIAKDTAGETVTEATWSMIGTWPSGVSLRTSTDGSATITYTSGVVYSEEGYDVTIKCTKNHYSTQMTVHLKTWGVPYQI